MVSLCAVIVLLINHWIERVAELHNLFTLSFMVSHLRQLIDETIEGLLSNFL